MRRFALVLALVGLVSGCGGDRPDLVDPGVEREISTSTLAAAAPSPRERALVRLAVDGWSGDPATAGPTDLGRRVVADLLFEGLTRLDSNGEAQPALADHWSVSTDRLTWIFTMPLDGVDAAGDPITARVVKASLERIAARGRDDIVASALDAIVGWDDLMTGRAGGLAGVSAPADGQLVIRLSRPFEPLPEVLAAPAFGIAVGDELGTTGRYRSTDADGELWPVDDGSTLPRIEIVEATLAESADLLAADRVDWAALPRGSARDDLPGNVVRVPLDVSIGVAVRLDDMGPRQAVLSAFDPVALAGAMGVTPVAPRVSVVAAGDAPASLTVDVPDGPLVGLGQAMVDQLIVAGVAAELLVSEPSEFVRRVTAAEAVVFPVVVPGGTWSAEDVAAALVPGSPNDLVAIDSADRTSLGDTLLEERDRDDRDLLEDVLVQTAFDEGVVLLIGRLDARVGIGPSAALIRHLADGRLDLAGFG